MGRTNPLNNKEYTQMFLKILEGKRKPNKIKEGIIIKRRIHGNMLKKLADNRYIKNISKYPNSKKYALYDVDYEGIIRNIAEGSKYEEKFCKEKQIIEVLKMYLKRLIHHKIIIDYTLNEIIDNFVLGIAKADYVDGEIELRTLRRFKQHCKEKVRTAPEVIASTTWETMLTQSLRS